MKASPSPTTSTHVCKGNFDERPGFPGAWHSGHQQAGFFDTVPRCFLPILHEDKAQHHLSQAFGSACFTSRCQFSAKGRFLSSSCFVSCVFVFSFLLPFDGYLGPLGVLTPFRVQAAKLVSCQCRAVKHIRMLAKRRGGGLGLWGLGRGAAKLVGNSHAIGGGFGALGGRGFPKKNGSHGRDGVSWCHAKRPEARSAAGRAVRRFGEFPVRERKGRQKTRVGIFHRWGIPSKRKSVQFFPSA